MADVRLTATDPTDSSVVPVACNAKGELLLEKPKEVVGPQGPQGPQGPPGPDGPPGPSFNGQLNAALEVQGSGDFTHTVTRDGRENIPSFVSKQGERNTFGQHFQAFNHGDVNPCFSINHDGSASFSGDVTAQSSLNVTGSGDFEGDVEMSSLYARSLITCIHSNSPALLIETSQVNSSIQPNLILVKAAPNGSSQETIFAVNYEGNYYFRGTGSFRNAVLNLEPDNDANYITTINKDEEGNSVENRVYNGPTLDVKEEILLLKAALKDVMEKIRMTPPAGWEVWDGSSENS